MYTMTDHSDHLRKDAEILERSLGTKKTIFFKNKAMSSANLKLSQQNSEF